MQSCCMCLKNRGVHTLLKCFKCCFNHWNDSGTFWYMLEVHVKISNVQICKKCQNLIGDQICRSMHLSRVYLLELLAQKKKKKAQMYEKNRVDHQRCPTLCRQVDERYSFRRLNMRHNFFVPSKTRKPALIINLSQTSLILSCTDDPTP